MRKRTSEPGVATGLAFTAVGGDILFFEATAYPGKGRLTITGQLGDVMQESAQAALSWVRAHTEKLGLESDWFREHDIHLHVPAGAVPKDGPSAGITMATAIASLVRNQPVSEDVGMTGEITLTGQVLPIGGIREKTLAAQRAGLKRIIMPRDNETEQLDARAAAGPRVEALEQRGRGDGDGEGREREVEAGEPQRREPEGEPDEPRHESCDRDRPHVPDAAADRSAELRVADHQNRARVAADGHERPVPERDLPCVAGEDVEAEERDQVDADVRVLLRLEVAQERGQNRDADDERGEADEPRDARRARAHTRFTSGLPKRPTGRTSKTTRMIRRAIGRRSSSVNQSNTPYWLT